jgi:uncharacterized membrane protein
LQARVSEPSSFALIAPFVLNFDPEARGIGFVHVRRPFGKWLGDHALIYGILIWPLLAAVVIRLRDAQRTWRWIGWGLAPDLKDAFDGSPLFRMNTVFKAGYQAFLLLGLTAGVALPWAAAWLPRRAWTPRAAIASVLR